MNNIQNALTINWTMVLVGVFCFLFAFKEMIEIFTYFKRKFRIHTGVEDDKNEIESRLDELDENNKEQDEKIDRISSGIDAIQKRLLNMEISGMRREILDMASGLSTNRKFTADHYNRIFSIYQDYEQILEENDMTNGQVEISMQLIQEAYKKALANGEI